jgi:hypothetical protein
MEGKMNRTCIATIAVCCLLTGCQTGAQEELSRMKTTRAAGYEKIDACEDAVAKTPAAQIVVAYWPPKEGPSLVMQASTAKATPEQVRAVFEFHASIAPCRKLTLETENAIHPSFVGSLVEYYSRADAAYLAVAERRTTWGEFARTIASAKIELQNQRNAVFAQISQGLRQSHDAEVAQRQRAMAAFSQWSLQQQLLVQQQQQQQQQQVLNRLNQPRVTDCLYIGILLQCTTY